MTECEWCESECMVSASGVSVSVRCTSEYEWCMVSLRGMSESEWWIGDCECMHTKSNGESQTRTNSKINVKPLLNQC